MSFQTGGPSGTVLNEINVTPLVDVMLVLLVIFMVTVPFMDQHVDIRLPTTEPVSNVTQAEMDQMLRIDQEGVIRFKGAVIPIEALQHNPLIKDQDEIYVYADGELRYAVVAAVLAKLHNAGIGRINFVVAPDSAEPPPPPPAPRAPNPSPSPRR